MNDCNKTKLKIRWLILWFAILFIWVFVGLVSFSSLKIEPLSKNIIYAVAFLVLGIIGLFVSRKMGSKVHGHIVLFTCILLASLAAIFTINGFLIRVIVACLIAETTAYCFAKYNVSRYSAQKSWLKRRTVEISGLLLMIYGAALSFIWNDWDGSVLFITLFGFFSLFYGFFLNWKKQREKCSDSHTQEK